MFDIKTLERKWLIYKVKSYLPHFLVLAITFVALILLNSLWTNEPKNEVVISEPVVQTENIEQNSSSEIEKEPVSDEQLILEPSMDFIANISTTPTYTAPAQTITPASQKPIIDNIITPQTLELPPLDKPLSHEQVTPAIQKSEPVSTKGKLAINRSDSKIDIASIEDRFKENSNASLGLFIAKYHYDNGNYSEAYNYALKTNSINAKMDENWIIFCKSLVKLGKKEQARRTLHLYIKESRSDEAIALLDAIDRGSFK